MSHFFVSNIVEISYGKALRLRKIVLGSIRGSPDESYIALPSYYYVLKEKNSGIITNIVTDNNNQFTYFVLCLLVHLLLDLIHL